MKVVCLISGGIDSPVAAYRMGKRESDLVLLHMDNSLERDFNQIEKAKNLARIICEATGKEAHLYVALHSRNQEKISEACERGFQCVLCKMLMLRVAKRLCMLERADAIVTGESLGQVASQTLHNIMVEQHGLDFPVLRPLIGLDKIEIEAIAKEVGTYGISIGASVPCRFVPDRPVTVARIGRAIEECAKLDMDEMVNYSIENLKQIV